MDSLALADRVAIETIMAADKLTVDRDNITRHRRIPLAEKLVEELQSNNAALPHELLSEREYEIFLMIAGGKTVSAIAEELSLSVATVSTHRRRILEKMGLSTNADIVQYAYANKLMQ